MAVACIDLSSILARANSRNDGAAYDVTDADVERADAYRPDDYSRVPVPLESGVTAWIYVLNPTSTSAFFDAEKLPATAWEVPERSQRMHDEIVRFALQVRRAGWKGAVLGHPRHFIAALAIV